MRDVLLTVIVFGALPFILLSPRLGAYVWAWLSFMNPHRALWGFARTLPFSQSVAIVTMVGFLFSRQRKSFPVNSITVTQVLLLFWMSFTCLFALNTPEMVLDRWLFVFKIQLMLFLTLMLIRGREQIERLIWVATASIGFYGVKGGVWVVMTGGANRVWGPPASMIEGNNELAVALVMLVPFMYYLYQVSTARWLRGLMLFSIGATSFAILGSQSRGALLSLIAMAIFLAIKGKRRIYTGLLLIALLASAASFMPDTWTKRMETIESYQDDTSAMSRIYTWKTLWALALDRPFTGAGFAADSSRVFETYAPPDLAGLHPGQVFVAHSIYFQALGEHGFPGLFLYLLLGFMTWRTAGKLAGSTREDAEFGSWVPLLMRSVQVSLIGFGVGGAFLSLLHFDLPFYIVAVVVLVKATVSERRLELQSVPRHARSQLLRNADVHPANIQ